MCLFAFSPLAIIWREKLITRAITDFVDKAWIKNENGEKWKVKNGHIKLAVDTTVFDLSIERFGHSGPTSLPQCSVAFSK